MKPHEAMQLCIGRRTYEFATRLHKSASTIGKWQEPHLHPDDSGLASPLDRLEQLIEVAISLGVPREEALAPLMYLNKRFAFHGSSVKDFSEAFFSAIREFSHVSAAGAEALEDGKVTLMEAKRIEKEALELSQRMADLLTTLERLQK